ncbi:MAG: SH3 domain-containing protein [Gammaproteobacteria bacterium]|nr:SH3 domain-containing protein [Gammaproteobacteria bacterium]
MRIILLSALLFLAGCASTGIVDDEAGPWDHTPDTERFTQSLGSEISQLQPGGFADIQGFKQKWFAPWNLSKAPHSFDEIHWARSFARVTSYDRNQIPNSQAHWDSVLGNLNQSGYAKLMQPAIAVQSVPLRALPTDVGAFKDASQPGEGYPFDYLQNAHLKLNTPLLLLNYSIDGRWALVQTPWLASWVRSEAIALIDDGLRQQLQGMSLSVVIEENDNIPELRLGTLLFNTGGQLQRASNNGTGGATLVPAIANSGQTSSFPLPYTRSNVERVANQLIGEGYGWGEIDNMRDCSAMTRDFFTIFGRFLPRNSKAQAREGSVIEVANFSRQSKRDLLRSQGIPFQTLIYLPGHIMLYIGERDGELIAMHNVWGVKTSEYGQVGRWVMGRGVITSLEPGRHHPGYVRSQSSLLEKATRFATIK